MPFDPTTRTGRLSAPASSTAKTASKATLRSLQPLEQFAFLASSGIYDSTHNLCLQLFFVKIISFSKIE
jgi:hypothetical protein